MKFTLTIKCENAAFHEDDNTGDSMAARGAEVARILRHVAEQVTDGITFDDYRLVFDVNGNAVGEWGMK